MRGSLRVNTSPTHAHHRYVINFGELTEDEARAWPDLMAIVEAKVKPERDQLADNPAGRRRKANWWQWGGYTPGLFRAVSGLERVITIAQTSRTVAFTFLSSKLVFSHKVVVFPLNTCASIASLQSRAHEIWARFFGSTMKDDAVYTPSDCFETFPFPPDWQAAPALEAAGQIYYDFRAALMVRNDEGLTKTYNRFHDPNERDPDILRLRELHAAMDRAVLDAYEWTDVPTECDFLLDYEIDEPTWGKKKKPYRYRWPDAVRDDVLARLLDLNQKRYQQELAAGLHANLDTAKPSRATKPKPPRKPAKRARKSNTPPGQATLNLPLGDEENDES